MEQNPGTRRTTPEPFPLPAVGSLPETSLDRVRRKLKTCQCLLTAPTASSMLACGACMGEVRLELEWLTAALRSAPLADRASLGSKVRSAVEDFQQSWRLLENAARLSQGWASMLASYLRGYTRHGAPATLRYDTETLLRG